MKKLLLLPILMMALYACDDDIIDEVIPLYKTCLTFGPGDEADIEAAFLSMTDSTKIILEAGNYDFEGLSLDGLHTVYIQGAGKDSTFLDFSSQTTGGEGISIRNITNVILRGFTAKDSKGDLIKLNQCTNVVLNNVSAVWSAVADSNSGGYALYPVLCTNVLIDSCHAQGASDAGIYVGQSSNAVVRNSTASGNVAGLEIENTTDAEVYSNELFGNTAGLLIFDLKGLSKRGKNVKAYDNYIHDNNLGNFAPSGGVVASVPAGTGVVHLAMSDVEYYNNVIENNNLTSMVVVSGFTGQPEITPADINDNYYPFPQNIIIRDNDMSKSATIPAATAGNQLGQALIGIHTYLSLAEADSVYSEMQHIVIDGINSNAITGGTEENPDNLCIDESEDQLFLDSDIANAAAGPPTWQYSLDVTPYVCQ